jgi:hypothetical protein
MIFLFYQDKISFIDVDKPIIIFGKLSEIIIGQPNGDKSTGQFLSKGFKF